MAEMTLLTRKTENTQKGCSGVYTVAAGKKLKIETTPNGEEMLKATVPTGKSWEVHIVVDIVETDA